MAEQTPLRHSRQREAIITFLRNRKDHPTADTVYQEIHNIIPNISLGTVYRNLSLLSERGEIKRLTCDGKVDRFDGNAQPHYHFICKDCGCVQDINMPYVEQLDQIAGDCFQGTITGHSLLFEGYCEACTIKQSEACGA